MQHDRPFHCSSRAMYPKAPTLVAPCSRAIVASGSRAILPLPLRPLPLTLHTLPTASLHLHPHALPLPLGSLPHGSPILLRSLRLQSDSPAASPARPGAP